MQGPKCVLNPESAFTITLVTIAVMLTLPQPLTQGSMWVCAGTRLGGPSRRLVDADSPARPLIDRTLRAGVVRCVLRTPITGPETIAVHRFSSLRPQTQGRGGSGKMRLRRAWIMRPLTHRWLCRRDYRCSPVFQFQNPALTPSLSRTFWAAASASSASK